MKIYVKITLLFASLTSLPVPSVANEGALADEAKATPPGGVEVVQINGVDQGPVVVKQVAPSYPMELRERGVQGVVMVDMLVDSTGRVVDATVARASHLMFAERAIEAAKAWTFKPATADGRAGTTRVRVPFEFVMPQVAVLEHK